MPAVSEEQRRAALVALAIKRGKVRGKRGSPAQKMADSMTIEQLEHFAYSKIDK